MGLKTPARLARVHIGGAVESDWAQTF